MVYYTIPMLSWELVVLGNTLRAYALAGGFFSVLVLIFWLTQLAILYRIHRMVQKTATDIDDTVLRLVEKIRPPVFIVLAIWAAVRTLTLSALLRSIVDGATVAVLVYQVIVTVQLLVHFVVARRLKKAVPAGTRDAVRVQASAESSLRIVNKITAVALWSLGALFILSNFGIDVTSLVAGLGIGGIAIALAAQNVLGDLFSSLAIFLDKPFAVGDFIESGDIMGTVKYVGIKTTRLKALSGEEVIVSNRDLTGARIKNLKRMEERRVMFEVGVAQTTAADVLDDIPQLLQQSIESVPLTRFGRANLVRVENARFVYEVVYRVVSPDFHIFRATHQEIILKIQAALAETKVALVSLV